MQLVFIRYSGGSSLYGLADCILDEMMQENFTAFFDWRNDRTIDLVQPAAPIQ